MQVIGADAIYDALSWGPLIEALRDAFAAGTSVAPPRQVLEIALPDGGTASLLLMPAWEAGAAIGVKVVTFFPGNAAQGKATINAGYLLFDGADGRMQAALEGDALTARRTAATSALAADYLARRDAAVLLVVGTGQLAGEVAQAHAAVRSYREILVWGRSASKAAAVADRLVALGLPATASDELEAACERADVLSTVTASTAPLVRGAWLQEGSHLDLVGAFKGDMRESDDAAIAGGTLFVDGREGAFKAGDLAQPIAGGVITADHVAADLSELCRGQHAGRRHAAERTIFKSVGVAMEDLVAARLALATR